MNEDTFVLSKLQEVVPGLDPAGFVSNVYLDDLNDCIDKFVNAFTDTKQDAGFLQRSPRSTRHQNVCQPLNFDDIRLISKGYALLLSWEREVDELMQNSLGGFSQKGQEGEITLPFLIISSKYSRQQFRLDCFPKRIIGEVENSELSENSETSENQFSEVFHSEFSVLHHTQNGKLGVENLWVFCSALWSNSKVFQL